MFARKGARRRGEMAHTGVREGLPPAPKRCIRLTKLQRHNFQSATSLLPASAKLKDAQNIQGLCIDPARRCLKSKPNFVWRARAAVAAPRSRLQRAPARCPLAHRTSLRVGKRTRRALTKRRIKCLIWGTRDTLGVPFWKRFCISFAQSYRCRESVPDHCDRSFVGGNARGPSGFSVVGMGFGCRGG